jgi:puromycin-sensitive aminopeptidase
VLDPLERLQLVGDTWAAVVAGEAELSEWAAAARAVAADPDPDVWASIAAVLTSLDLIVSDADRPVLQRLAEELARAPWEQVGWDPRPGESERTATARARIAKVLADFGRDPEVIGEAKRRFATHLEAPIYDPLAPDLVGVAARISVSEGGEHGWSEVLDAYRDAEGPHAQLRYLHALSETPHLGLRIRTLELMAGPEVRSQDAPFVIAEVMARRGAAPEVWGWVEANWDRMVARFPSSLLTRVFEATAAIVDPDLAARVHQFCAGRDLPISAVRMAQILERMDVQVALAERLRDAIPAGLT